MNSVKLFYNKQLKFILIIFLLGCNSNKTIFRDVKNGNGVLMYYGGIYYLFPNTKIDLFQTEKINDNDLGLGFVVKSVNNFMDVHECMDTVEVIWNKEHNVNDEYNYTYFSNVNFSYTYSPELVEALKEEEKKINNVYLNLKDIGRLNVSFSRPRIQLNSLNCRN